VIWPSAYRAWGLVGGAKVHADSALLNPKPVQRPKRPAEDAFGTDDKNGLGPLPHTFNFASPTTGADVPVTASSETSIADRHLLASMLGIDLPSNAEPSPPYVPKYEWWQRDLNQPRTPDSSHTMSSPSPRSGSSHSSPAAAMPIPFSFDQSNFWDSPLLQDMSVNFSTGV
jgi:hypothetical protein